MRVPDIKDRPDLEGIGSRRRAIGRYADLADVGKVFDAKDSQVVGTRADRILEACGNIIGIPLVDDIRADPKNLKILQFIRAWISTRHCRLVAVGVFAEFSERPGENGGLKNFKEIGFAAEFRHLAEFEDALIGGRSGVFKNAVGPFYEAEIIRQHRGVRVGLGEEIDLRQGEFARHYRSARQDSHRIFATS